MPKHGAEMHLVRPDRVGYTSVLQAIPGYLPVQNAYDVAQRFVTAPYYATGPGSFAGLRDAAKMSVADRIKLFFYKLRIKRAQRRANAVAQQVAQLPAGSAIAPVSQQGNEVALQNKENAALMLTAGMAASGDDIMPPSVVKPEITAGTRLSWNYSVGEPFDFASNVMMQVQSPYIGEKAAQAAWQRWIAARTRPRSW